MWLKAALRYRGVVGVLGSVLITLGAFVYAKMPRSGQVAQLLALGPIRRSPHAELWGLASCFAGLALLTIAWLLLGIAVRTRLAGRDAVNRAALLWAAPLLIAPPLFSGDGWSYAADGYLAGRGVSPYVVTPSVLHGPIVQAVCGCWRHTPAPYGPTSMLWGGLFGRLTGSPWVLMLSFRLLAVIGLVLLMWAVPRLARMTGVHEASASWLVVASPFVLTAGVGGVHLDLVMIGIVAVAIAITPRRGWFVGALLIGLATSIKAPAAVAGIGVVVASLQSDGFAARLRRTAEVAGVAGGVVALSSLVSGFGFGWIKAMNAALILRSPLSLTYDVRYLLRVLDLPHTKVVLNAAGVAILAIALLWLLWRAPVRRPGSAVLTVALAMGLTTVLSPVTNYWYYFWCLPLLAACRLPRVARCVVGGLVAAMGLIGPLDPALRLPHSNLVVFAVVVLGMVLGGFGDRFLDAIQVRPPKPVPAAV